MSIFNFDLSSFKRAQQEMIATNANAWDSPYSRRSNTKLRDYSLEEIQNIIGSGSIDAQQRLSRNYFYKDGFYRRIILYYATLLKNAGLVIPHSPNGQSLSNSSSKKRYNQVLSYLENMDIKSLCTNWSMRALVDGCYYGVICVADRNSFAMMDLPVGYCCTRFKDFKGNDIIEFDVSYFNTIPEEDKRKEALAIYPKVVADYYKKWIRGKVSSKWVAIPTEVGVCFPLFDKRPLFLNVIPATIQYDEAVDTERERDLEEIRKIIVQKIPHLTDGGLLFEPEEAQVIHTGTVGMMKNNKNVSVLTTYADVDAIVSKTASDNTNTTLEKMLNNVYAEAGVTGQVFAATGNLAIETSIKNDVSLMMVLANHYSNFITSLLNKLFGNQNISFKYNIYPISYYNDADYASNAYKLAQGGYSYLLPALAMDITQRDLVNLKELENDVLGLGEVLVPLASSFTQSANASTGEVGRPALSNDKKSEKTIANEQSLDSQGGSE